MKQNNPLHRRVLEKIWRDVLRKCHFLFAGNNPGAFHQQAVRVGVYSTRKEQTMLDIQKRTQCVASHPVTDREDERFHLRVHSISIWSESAHLQMTCFSVLKTEVENMFLLKYSTYSQFEVLRL